MPHQTAEAKPLRPAPDLPAGLRAEAPGAGTLRLAGPLEAFAALSGDEIARLCGGPDGERPLIVGIERTLSRPVPDLSALRRLAERRAGPLTMELRLSPEDAVFARTAAERDRRDLLHALTASAVASGLRVLWALPVLPSLIYRLDGLWSQARALGAEPVLVAGADDGLAEDDAVFLDDFLRYRVLETDRARLGPAAVRAYEAALAALATGRPGDLARALAPLAAAPASAEADGARAGGPPLGEAVEVLIDGARGHAFGLLAPQRARDRQLDRLRLPRVLLIGAYGGEHIGDMAILGGVARRLHERHETGSAILMTQRPRHTRHLVGMIRTPIEIEVRDYTHAEIDRALQEVDAVIHAGGPLIDLPKQLVRHLYAAARAKRLGKPFLMEGIGPGPFTRLPSKLTARRLVSLADRIAVRTREDAGAAILAGAPVIAGRDPAFDYLETRPAALDALGPGEEAALDRLLEGAEGRPLIGINTRPIYSTFTVGPKGADKAKLTADVQDRFEREMAAALTRLSGAGGARPVFVFFPMNAVQFGLSDLQSAFRIARHLPPEVDFRVWEADASLDGVLALIRRLDGAITMRFHATIFCLSQGIDVVGVDYRIGKRYKVASVLSDAGREDQCTRIDLLTADWMVDQLTRLLDRRRGKG